MLCLIVLVIYINTDMEPKLVEAIKERIKAGHTKEQIQTEVTATGYDTDSFEAAYVVATKVEEVAQVEGQTVARKDEALNFSRLFSSSWQMAKGNIALLWKTVLTFGLSLLLVGVAAGAIFFRPQEFAPEESLYILIGMAFFAVFFAVSILCFGALLRGLLHRSAGESFRTHFKWSLTHAIDIIIVSFYVSTLTQVGYLFFIIPGLMLAVYLIFATFFVAAENQSGVVAMITSTKLVYGRFWPVLIPILLSTGVLIAVFIAGALAATMLSVLNPLLIPVFMLLSIVVVVVGGFWQLCFLITLFESLQKVPSSVSLPLSEKALATSYRVVIGVVVVLMLLVGLLVALVVL